MIAETGRANHACKNVKINDPSVPECPASGVLGERFPPLAMVISDEGAGSDYRAIETIVKILATERVPPLLVLNVKDNTYRALNELIVDMSEKNPKKAAQLKAAIRRVNGPAYQWNQDFMQSYSNPTTGRPQVRDILNYRKAEHLDTLGGGNKPSDDPRKKKTETQALFSTIANVLAKECGVENGPGLGQADGGVAGGHAGGNIESGPGDLCLVGDDQLERVQAGEADRFSKEACGGAENVMRVPTSWLAVGHTDEITSTINTGPGPCDFAVLVASPEAARESFRSRGSDPAWSFPSRFKNDVKKEAMESSAGMSAVCRHYLKLRDGGPPKEGSGFRAFLDRLFGALVARGFAEVGISPKPPVDVTPCLTMTNDDMLAVLKANPSLNEYNNLVEKEMNDFTAKYIERVKASRPQCKDVEKKFHKVPGLFIGEPGKRKGQPILPPAFGNPNNGVSVYPNLTNGVRLKDAYYSPEPGNAAFKKTMESLLSDKLKVKTQFVDTTIDNINGGNLHCVTNVVRYCRPRAAK